MTAFPCQFLKMNFLSLSPHYLNFQYLNPSLSLIQFLSILQLGLISISYRVSTRFPMPFRWRGRRLPKWNHPAVYTSKPPTATTRQVPFLIKLVCHYPLFKWLYIWNWNFIQWRWQHWQLPKHCGKCLVDDLRKLHTVNNSSFKLKGYRFWLNL